MFEEVATESIAEARNAYTYEEIDGCYQEAKEIADKAVSYTHLYSPKMLLSLVVFAYINGVYSCRGIANIDRKSTRLNSSHVKRSRMPSSA